MGNLQDIQTALENLTAELSERPAHIANLKRLSGGASQETWAFELVCEAWTRGLILRRAPGGGGSERSSHAIDLVTEAALIRAAAAAGVPAPNVVHVCRVEDGLGEGFVMDKLEGETIAPKILRGEPFASARNVLASQCGKALAGIHALDLSALPDLPTSFGLDQVNQYEDIYLGFDVARPTFDLAISWLRANTPAPLESVLVHGDFRLGNLMVDEAGLAGVLDWELAHIGDPREDIAWACINSWRFGQSEKRVGGFGDLPDLLAAYREAGGPDISKRDIDWWEMLGSLKWGVMCLIMYEAYRSGADPSVERAAIGRRVSETEIDLINLLERV